MADDVVAGHLPVDRMNDVSPLYLLEHLRRPGDPSHSAGVCVDPNLRGTLAAALLAALTARRLAGDIAGLAAALAMLASRTVVLTPRSSSRRC